MKSVLGAAEATSGGKGRAVLGENRRLKTYHMYDILFPVSVPLLVDQHARQPSKRGSLLVIRPCHCHAAFKYLASPG
ncbi:hypothetical protein E2C01_068267 [Portunus trituberculatus]|uniref:Uncharacterized protein n=1 Tax=Portunus trituberculatus TaxID=210409 RepID=A0A5B7HZK3_PORTR|nr:hypothetical protein [Portunus trituberculatus]